MDITAHFAMLAAYNRIANERIYEACAKLPDAEYKRERRGSFGSIHGLLNHTLLADGIWMARFEGAGQTTPPLNTILADTFEELRQMREAEDQRIEDFFGRLRTDFWDRKIEYTNSKGIWCSDSAAMDVAHFFNHQTHHRGQVHVMLSQTDVQPPSLDLHRIINP